MVKKISIVLGLLGLFFGSVYLVKISTKEPKIEYARLPALNPYPHSVAANGIIEASQENIAIGVPVAGLVTDLYVKVWEQVKKGQPLFKLDDRDLQSELQVEKTNVLIAENQLQRLKDQLARLESAKDPRSVSREDMRTKIDDVAIADAQLKNARAKVENKEVLINRLTVMAPRDGVILQSNIRPGEYVSLTPSVPPIVLGDLSHMQIRVDVDEQNAYLVQPDAPATAFPKNNPSLPIPLHFVRIEPYVIPKKSLTGLSEEKIDTRVLQIIYTFNSPKDFPIYVGQQVDVFIKVETKS